MVQNLIYCLTRENKNRLCVLHNLLDVYYSIVLVPQRLSKLRKILASQLI